MKISKLQKEATLKLAQRTLDHATSIGCKASIKSGMVVFTPPLPIGILFDAVQCEPQLKKLINKKIHKS